MRVIATEWQLNLPCGKEVCSIHGELAWANKGGREAEDGMGDLSTLYTQGKFLFNCHAFAWQS